MSLCYFNCSSWSAGAGTLFGAYMACCDHSSDWPTLILKFTVASVLFAVFTCATRSLTGMLTRPFRKNSEFWE